MISAILILPGVSRTTHPNRVADFVWSDVYGEYIWQGKELTIDEFNAAAPRVIALAARPIVPRIIVTAPAKSNDDGRLTKARQKLAEKRRQTESLQPA